MKIACIGSRKLSQDVRRALWNTGRLLALNGHDVVSGNARGSDQAFGAGVNSVNRKKLRLCLPWQGFEQSAIRKGNRVMVAWDTRYSTIASKHHPCWDELGDGTRRLMARNVAIVEGADLVIGYPSLEKPWGGGTGFGLVLARAMGKPVVELARGEGQDHLLHAFDGLAWPESQDSLLELVWFQRLGGRLDRAEYEDRMCAVGAVLLADLAELSASKLADALARLPASLLWRMLDGRDWRHFPEYDEEDCIEWRAAFGRIREDPIRARVLLPVQVPGDPVERDDEEAPERELRAILQPDDSGNPIFDRERLLARLHGGQRRWAECCRAMPSGIVLQSVEPERKDPDLRDVKELSWTLFRQPPWTLPSDDLGLLWRLHELFIELELDDRHRREAVREIVRTAYGAQETIEVLEEPVQDPVASIAEMGRRVIRCWIVDLERAVEPPAPEAQGDIDWTDMEKRIRLRYPNAHDSFVRFALESAKATWARWQSVEALEVPHVDEEPEDQAQAEDAPYQEQHFVVVGHLWRSVVPWEERRPRDVRELYEQIGSVTRADELAELQMQVESGYAGWDRVVLDVALRLARSRVGWSCKRAVARKLARISGATSIKHMERLREAIPHPDARVAATLVKAIDSRILTLKTLRSGNLTEALKRRIRSRARSAGASGGTFSPSYWRGVLLADLGKARDALLDVLVERVRHRFLSQALLGRIVEVARTHHDSFALASKNPTANVVGKVATPVAVTA